jgi:hypothetical protein
LYTDQQIISVLNFAITCQSCNTHSINIKSLEKGYYKVLVKIGGVIYWDNFYKYDKEGDNENQFTAIRDFWK